MISSCTVESTRTITATLSPCLGSALIVFIDDSFFFPFLTISHRFACVTKVRRHINRDQSGFAIFCLIEKSCEEADNLPIQTFSPRKLSTISKLPWNSSARSPRTLLTSLPSSVCRSWVSNAAIFALEISASCSVRSAFVVACAIAKSNWIPASQELLFCI